MKKIEPRHQISRDLSKDEFYDMYQKFISIAGNIIYARQINEGHKEVMPWEHFDDPENDLIVLMKMKLSRIDKALKFGRYNHNTLKDSFYDLVNYTAFLAMWLEHQNEWEGNE